MNSTVSVGWVTPELPELMIYLDPENLTVQRPRSPDGDLVLSRFLRDMSREAAKLATELEARRAAGPAPEEPTTRALAPQELTDGKGDHDNGAE